MHLFISGTGTGIGKTLVSSWLCLHLKADYFKPIQTGSALGMDSQTVVRLSGAKIHKETYVYEEAVSPHLAALNANKFKIDLDQMKLPAVKRLIVEGAGGLLVPINENFFMIDLIKALNLPVILVSSSSLGTINHTLLSLEALAAREIKVLGIILNGELNQANCEALEFYGRTKVLAQIPHLDRINKAALSALALPQILQQALNDLSNPSPGSFSYASTSDLSLKGRGEYFAKILARNYTSPLVGEVDKPKHGAGLSGEGYDHKIVLDTSIRDKKIIWHPFTQAKTAGLPLAISKAKGSYLYDEQGKAYLDLISSWWVNLHGHANEQIAKSIFEQALTLEHVIFAGFTHSPAVELCETLKKYLPATLERFFFSDNGSTCVEAALKMAYQYWHNLEGKASRNLFLCFDGGYHGDTFGAMSAGRSHFHDKFEQLFFKSVAIPYPATFENDHGVESKEQNALRALDEQLSKFGNQIAAIILEPLVQGASGMRMCRPSFLQAVIERVRQYQILVIFDEVMTGFGRTGTLFALNQVGVVPDFLCLSKGITGGFLPLALTVTTNQIYSAFLSDQWHKAFAHGHSYTANPLACRAAITSLQLLLNPDTQAAIAAINSAHKVGLNYLAQRVDVAKNFRVLGTIAAFEIENISPNFKAACLNDGLLIRPLGNTVYLLPPYSTTVAELENAYNKVAKILQNLTCLKNARTQTFIL